MSNEENKQTEIQTDEHEKSNELTDQDLKNVAGRQHGGHSILIALVSSVKARLLALPSGRAFCFIK